MTLVDVLQKSTDYLKDKGVARARRVAEELIAHVLKIKRLDLYLQHDRPLIEEELEQIRGFIKRAARNEPLEYIIENVSFYHCDLRITPDVLIPRPETEILVDAICRQMKEGGEKVAWDVCCGPGSIGIAVKKALPILTVVLSDISEKALALASANAKRNGVEVETVLGDLLQPFQGRKADAIFCNPPYISQQEYAHLDPSVRNFEPQLALVGGEDGLIFYRRLAEELPPYLQPGAKLFFEIGAGQGESVQTLFNTGHWRNKRVEKDWSGHDRFFFLEFE